MRLRGHAIKILFLINFFLCAISRYNKVQNKHLMNFDFFFCTVRISIQIRITGTTRCKWSSKFLSCSSLFVKNGGWVNSSKFCQKHTHTRYRLNIPVCLEQVILFCARCLDYFMTFLKKQLAKKFTKKT